MEQKGKYNLDIWSGRVTTARGRIMAREQGGGSASAAMLIRRAISISITTLSLFLY